MTRGSADLELVLGRDTERNLVTGRIETDLSPAGRELDFEAFYRLELTTERTLTTSAMLRSEPGLSEDTGPEGVFFLHFEHSF